MRNEQISSRIRSIAQEATFYHVHIPKCGGTSIAAFFNEITKSSQSIWLDRFEHAPNIIRQFILSNSKNIPMTEADCDRSLIRFQRETNVNNALAKIWSRHVNEKKPKYVHNPFSKYMHIEYSNSVFLFPVKSTFERYISYLKHFEKFNDNDLMYLTPREHVRLDQIRNWPVEKLIDFTYSENCEPFNEFSFSEIDDTIINIMKSIKELDSFVNKVSFLKKNAIKVDEINSFLNDQAIQSNVPLKVLNSGKSDSRFRGLSRGDLNKKSSKFLDMTPDEQLWNEFSS
jgi:hypothetical protein